MKAEHNSQSDFYRLPFGAVKTGSRVTLSIAIEDVGIPKAITLVTDKGRENMFYARSLGEYNVYTAVFKLPAEPCKIWYYFELDTSEGLFFYGNNADGLGGVGTLCDRIPERKFQITVYEKEYKTPEWLKKGICYQIFPDRFCKEGDFLAEKPHMKKRSWGETPYYRAEQFGGKYDCSDFFGGNLKGILSKLDYLAELGINIIYLNPIFEAYSNHRYDTGNYEKIDSLLGTEEDFKKLCAEAKKRGIRIILDGVFNHTGSDSKYFNKNGNYSNVGAYQSQSSPYYKWYRFFDFPDRYESWWGMETLPQVEETDESYRRYILSDKDAIIKKWIKSGASGWRLDVADELPDSFIKELRREVKKTDPNAAIIGEVWEDASNKVAYGEEREYLLGGELDSVMNYPLRRAIIDFALERIDAREFSRRVMSIKENYPREAFYSLLNFLSSHDVERIITILGGEYPEDKDARANYRLSGAVFEKAKGRLFASLTLLFTMPGVPCLFYGDEAGAEGFGDPFCRCCFPWGEENTEILERVKKLIKLRKSSEVFALGEMETVYAEGMTYAILRRDCKEGFVTAVNFGHEREIRLDLARFGVEEIELPNGERQKSPSGIFYVKIGCCDATVLRSLYADGGKTNE